MKRESSTKCKVCGEVPLLLEMYYPEVGCLDDLGRVIHEISFLDLRCCSVSCLAKGVEDTFSKEVSDPDIAYVVVMPKEVLIHED